MPKKTIKSDKKFLLRQKKQNVGKCKMTASEKELPLSASEAELDEIEMENSFPINPHSEIALLALEAELLVSAEIEPNATAKTMKIGFFSKIKTKLRSLFKKARIGLAMLSLITMINLRSALVFGQVLTHIFPFGRRQSKNLKKKGNLRSIANVKQLQRQAQTQVNDDWGSNLRGMQAQQRKPHVKIKSMVKYETKLEIKTGLDIAKSANYNIEVGKISCARVDEKQLCGNIEANRIGIMHWFLKDGKRENIYKNNDKTSEKLDADQIGFLLSECMELITQTQQILSNNNFGCGDASQQHASFLLQATHEKLSEIRESVQHMASSLQICGQQFMGEQFTTPNCVLAH